MAFIAATGSATAVGTDPVYPGIASPATLVATPGVAVPIGTTFAVTDPSSVGWSSVVATVSTSSGTLQATAAAGAIVTGSGTTAVTVTGTITGVENTLNGAGGGALTITTSAASTISTSIRPSVSFTSGGTAYSFNSANGHYYRLVSSASLNWADASSAAQAAAVAGVSGYLTTVTSASEWAFVDATIAPASDSWLAARRVSQCVWSWDVPANAPSGENGSNVFSFDYMNSGQPFSGACSGSVSSSGPWEYGPNTTSGSDALKQRAGAGWDSSASSGTKPYIVEFGSNSTTNYPAAATTAVTLTGLTPVIGSPTSTSDGFTTTVTNFDAAYTWTVVPTAGAATIDGAGVVRVTGLAAGAGATATVTATRAGYASASSAVTGSALAGSGGGGGGGGGAPPAPVVTPTPTVTPSVAPTETPQSTESPAADVSAFPTGSPPPSPSVTRSAGQTATPRADATTSESQAPTTSRESFPQGEPSASAIEQSPSTPTPSATEGTPQAPGPAPSAPQDQDASIFVENAPAGPEMEMTVDLALGATATGRAVTVRASGLKPGSPVEVVLHSTPRVIGVGTTDVTGSAAVQATIPAGLEPGTHTLYANGFAPGGEPVQSVGLFEIDPSQIVTAIAPPGQVATPVAVDDPQLARALKAGKPVYDPSLYPASTAAITVAAVALLGIAGIGGMASLRSSGEAYSERGKLAVIVTKKLKVLAAEGAAIGDRSRTWRLPGLVASDDLMAAVPVRVGRFSALGQRVLIDGAWARAMFGTGGFTLWALGLLVGVYGAATVGFAPFPPALPIVLAILVIGLLDAAAGAIAWLVVALGALVTGQLTTLADLRTILGLFVLYATLPLLAHVIRPLRRRVLPDAKAWFDRVCDYIMMPFFVAFAAASMFKALNGLSGLELTDPDDLWTVRIVVILACWLRLGVEDTAAHAYPERSKKVQPEKLASPDTRMAIISVALRVAVFLLIAAPFFGLGWVTWLAAALFSIPMILKIWEDDLPNSAWLNKWFPRGLPRFAMLLVIGVYLAAWVLGQLADGSQSRDVFNLLLLPGIVAGIIELIGREGGDWPDTWRKRVAGGVIWALAAGITAGLIVLA